MSVTKVKIRPLGDKVLVKMDRGDSVSMLEVEIEIPTPVKAKPPVKVAEAAVVGVAVTIAELFGDRQRSAGPAHAFLPRPRRDAHLEFRSHPVRRDRLLQPVGHVCRRGKSKGVVER